MIPLEPIYFSIPMSEESFKDSIGRIAEHFRTYHINSCRVDVYDSGEAFYIYSSELQTLIHASNLKEIEIVIEDIRIQLMSKFQPKNREAHWYLN